jgi:hypothetical protein
MPDPRPPLLRHEAPETDLAHKREVARRVDEIQQQGRVSWTGDVTLATTPATSTEVKWDSVITDSQITLQPLSAEAAALAPLVWIDPAGIQPALPWTGVTVSKFTIYHPKIDAGVVATLRYCVKG